MKHIVFSILATITVVQVYSQQLPQFSQYFFNDYVINPAVAGASSNIDVRTNYRYQWIGINDAPRTYSLSFAMPLRKDNMGIGGYVYSDVAGPFSRTGAQGSFSYIFKITEKIKLSAALSLGLVQIGVDGQRLTLYNQDDQILDGSVQRAILFDGKFGMQVYSDDWFVGFSAPQLVQSKVKIANDPNLQNGKLEDHYLLMAGYKYNVIDKVQVEPSILAKFVAPTPLSLDVMARLIYDKKVWLGASYRHQDAWSALIGYTFQNHLSIGYSYDITTSNLANYSQGTHELVLGLKFSKQSASKPASEAVE